MRLDELPRSDRIDDRRGGPGIPMGRAGGLGIGTIIILGLIGWALGINLTASQISAQIWREIARTCRTSRQQSLRRQILARRLPSRMRRSVAT